MNVLTTTFRQHIARLTAIALILTLYALARIPDLSSAERKNLSAPFRFSRSVLPQLPGQPHKQIRAVSPSVKHIATWVSAVGAAVALNDLDGDGLSNDLCHVDPRDDLVSIAPAPGTGARYAQFALNAGPLYDPQTMAPMGCVPGDLNDDGFVDVLVYYAGRTPVVFLRKKDSGPGKKALSSESYLAQEVVRAGSGVSSRWYTTAATLTDLDGDGHVDLVVGNYFPDDCRIIDPHSTVPERMQHSMARAFNGGRNYFLRWEGATSGDQPSVQFKVLDDPIDGDQDEKIIRGWTLAAGAADLDGDLLPEIYFANDFGPDRLLYNRSKPGDVRFVVLEGERTFSTPGSKVLGHDSFKGMGVDFGDLNRDGLLDIYVSNIATEYGFQEGHFLFLSTGATKSMPEGVAPYVDAGERLGLSRSGWGWDVKFGDFDNSGEPEILQATGLFKGETNRWPELQELSMVNDQLLEHLDVWPNFLPGDGLSSKEHNPFFVRAQDGRFYDVARELDLAASQISRGIATADVDGDGRLDFAVANQWEDSYFYNNTSPHPGAFLGLYLRRALGNGGGHQPEIHHGHLALDGTSQPAIGASVKVSLPDGRRLVAQVDGGNGHSGKRSSDLHFGLGALPSNTQLQVELRWRDKSGQMQAQMVQLSPGWYTVILGS